MKYSVVAVGRVRAAPCGKKMLTVAALDDQITDENLHDFTVLASRRGPHLYAEVTERN
jgi:hypothetical protein